VRSGIRSWGGRQRSRRLLSAAAAAHADHAARTGSIGKVFWEPECVSFRTAAHWASVFQQCPRIEHVVADTLPDGWRHWRDYEQAAEERGKNPFPSDAEALDRDQGRYIGFVRVRARRNASEAVNLYAPGLAEPAVTGTS